MDYNYESDIISLAKAVKIVRQETFTSDRHPLNGSFTAKCHEKSVPTRLKLLVSMLLNGANVKDQESLDSYKCLTIPKLITFNCNKVQALDVPWATASTSFRYKHPHRIQVKEGGKPTFMTLAFCMSYDRILQGEDQLAKADFEGNEHTGVVSPSQLRHGVFTVRAVDRLDHYPSSTIAKGSFHGTSRSLFQYPQATNMGCHQD